MSYIDTPLGPLVALSGEKALYLLEFADHFDLKHKMDRMKKQKLISGTPLPVQMIRDEINLYFEGKLKHFKTPLSHNGTPFQNQIGEALLNIPWGETRSYTQIAETIEKPSSFRAAAQAIGANPFVIIVPCHRVINKNGGLGGYGGGLYRKKWLLTHEK